jgi:hypothetical protein
MGINFLVGTKLFFAKFAIFKFAIIPTFILFGFQATQDMNLGPIAGLVGSLGSAGAAVIVVIYFLAYVRDQGKIIESMKNSNEQMQKNYQNSLDDVARKFIKRQEDLQDFFEKQLRTLSAAQNEILKETIITVKGFERTMEILHTQIELILIKVRPDTVINMKPVKSEPDVDRLTELKVELTSQTDLELLKEKEKKKEEK